MDSILQPLQAQEALQLAMRASEQNDYDRAISYLTDVLQREPIHPELYYFLGIQYAELELYQRAISGLQKAIDLAGEFEIAEFQLGLLYLQTNQSELAATTFHHLGQHVQDPALRAFCQAYEALLTDDIPLAQQALQMGIECCTHNRPLQADMQRVLVSLTDATAIATPPSGSDSEVAPPTMTVVQPPTPQTESKTPRFLGAYLDTLEDDHGPH